MRKVYVFTATCQDHGCAVISVTTKKPTQRQQWQFLTEHLRKALGKKDVVVHLDEYAATNFEITHEIVRE